ncbi:Inner membrane transport protein YdhC [Pandoraea iniqua]|uniref:MFS transporter n=1 Tax=Pandoraea iniqua TaxID=2508288 RepID=UPI00123F31E9|nr:MFS transporter [Pandoraea iniqua]VVD59792.1 Inner membrane transport protein YdhC [Pandoraea iniqua]
MRRIEILILINALTALSALLVDVMLPSFEAMARAYRTDIDAMTAIVGYVLISSAVLPLVAGPVSDRFGRRNTLIAGLAVALVGAVGGAWAPSYAWHVAARLLQAGGCSAFVLSQAILQDAYPGHSGLRVRIFTLTFSGICIAGAPLLGAALQASVDWQASFWLFAGMSAATCALAGKCLPAHATPATHAAHSPTTYVRRYQQIVTHRVFLKYSVTGAMAFSCHVAFVILSPTLFLDQFGYSIDEYAYVLLFYGLVNVACGIVASRLTRYIDIHRQIRVGTQLFAFAGALMVLLGVAATPHVATILCPMLFVSLAMSLIRPATATLAMALFETHAGTAAAVMGAMRFLVAGALGVVTSMIPLSKIDVMTLLIPACAVTALLCAPRESCRSRVRQS